MDAPTYRCTCGSSLFVIDLAVRGRWSQFVQITAKGVLVDDTNLDRLVYGKEPRTMKCGDCGKLHPNPNFKR